MRILFRVVMIGVAALVLLACSPSRKSASPAADAVAAPEATVAQTAPGPIAEILFNGNAAGLMAYDAAARRAFVVDEAGARVDILDVTDSAAPTLTGSIDTSPYGQNPTSVAASNGVVAITVEANKKTADGTLLLADANGVILSDVKVGALPVAVAFTADGLHLVVANQGEVNKEGTKDPEGSISIIDLRDGAAKVGKKDVRTAGFSQFNDSTLDPRIFAIVPGSDDRTGA